MKLDLSALNYKDRIDISGKVSYDAKFLENSPIKKLDDVNYSGFITRNDIDEYFINIHIYGTMVLLDSVSLEELDYPYDINIDDEITDFIKTYAICHMEIATKYSKLLLDLDIASSN